MSLYLFSRLQSFTDRVAWLSRFTATPVGALVFLLRARGDKSVKMQGHYDAAPLSFRGCDISALKEVLVDKEYEFLGDLLRALPQPVTLDVGAHIGTFGAWCLKTNPAAQILSVEADPSTFTVLQDNVRGDGWRCVNKAAWKNNDDIVFSDKGDAMSHRVSADGQLNVRGITLGELLDFFPDQDVDLLKVDIEGAEESFLCADPAALARVQHLVIELHPHLCDVERVRAVIGTSFFHVEEIQGRISSKPLLFCKK